MSILEGKRRNSLERLLAKARPIAAAQHGLLTSEQLASVGLTHRSARARLAAAGRLVRMHGTVWRLAEAEPTDRCRWLAACLNVGDGILSHQAAGKFYGLDGMDDRLHVTVRRKGVSSDEVVIHCSPALPDAAISKFGPLRVTRIERTLLDLAKDLDVLHLQMAVECAWRKKLVVPVRLLAKLERVRRSGAGGLRKLRALLTDSVTRGRPLGSALEVQFWRAVREAKPALPTPRTQVEVRDEHGFSMFTDFMFPEHRLVVETQGFDTHGNREAFEDDAVRTSRLVAAGFAVMPVTRRMLANRPGEVLALVREALEEREGPGARAPTFNERTIVSGPMPD